ncbi:unnamed protein product [Clavelina lepadiformis]|uniref:Nuclear pore complex protein n=1 Tax=Clavelina lepadiformis TaxID=159417 RepID=A0ABP0FBT4_CLALP
MDMSSIVPSPATARDGRSKSKRAGKILQTMKMLDEAVTPKNDAMMSAIGSMPNQIVSTPANHLNVYDHSLFGSHLSTGQNLSMISEPNNTLLMEPTINLLELSTPTQMSMTDTTANFNYAMLENPGLEATASIFMDFKKCLSQHGMSCDIYDLISSYEEICDDYEQLLKKIMTQVTPENSAIVERLGKYLKEEKHTWRLVHSLFRDKFSNCSEEAMAVNDALVFYTSEKNIIDDYFDNDSDIRQAQIVIDWLERNAADELTNIADQLQHYTGCVTWENTLHHLKARKSRGTTTADGMILEMDPDAPTRTRKPLADLDREDESRLLKCVFSFIRGGRINEAEDLCVSHGQPWRAATLEGWKLHHDPNTVNSKYSMVFKQL